MTRVIEVGNGVLMTPCPKVGEVRLKLTRLIIQNNCSNVKKSGFYLVLGLLELRPTNGCKKVLIIFLMHIF